MPNKLRVLVTGGGGFLGRYLVSKLQKRKFLMGSQVESIMVLDCKGEQTQEESGGGGIRLWPNVKAPLDCVRPQNLEANVTDRKGLMEAIKTLTGNGRLPGQLAVFHLASIMSGHGEEDFDECFNVNVEGTRNVLECCREVTATTGSPPRLVLTSSVAAFGSQKEVTDNTKHIPQSTYGFTNACAEMMVNDYTRKGWVDGRVGRLATVMVRPGPSNRAVTACYSAVVREVLKGNDLILKVDPRHVHPVTGVTTAVKSLIALLELQGSVFGPDRAMNTPAIHTSLDELLFHTEQIGSARGLPLGAVKVKLDEATNRVVKSFPSVVHYPRALQCGLPRDRHVEEIIQQFVDEFFEEEMLKEYPLV